MIMRIVSGALVGMAVPLVMLWLDLPGQAKPLSFAPMSFTFGRLPTSKPCGLPCVDFIVAEGQIGAGSAFFYQLSVAILGKNKVPVLLHSPGGLAFGGYGLGRAFRHLDAQVAVIAVKERACTKTGQADCPEIANGQTIKVFDLLPRKGECHSACSIALAGATTRIIPAGGQIGIHKPKLDRDDPLIKSLDQHATMSDESVDRHSREGLGDYYAEMGFDDRIADWTMQTPHETLRYLTRKELRDTRFHNPANTNNLLPHWLHSIAN
jgi:hypothetical protein